MSNHARIAARSAVGSISEMGLDSHSGPDEVLDQGDQKEGWTT
jgi:hypothetical protein